MKGNRVVPLDFVVPVILENMVVLVVGLLFSRSISSISDSALAATGLANTVLAVVFALFGFVITGASVVVSRQNGERDYVGAMDTIERTCGLSLYVSAAMAVVLILLSQPLLRLLEPGAEPQFFAESLRYFRVLMISLPLYVMHSVIAGVCRALGDTKRPMVAYVLMNIAQLGFAWLFIRVLHMEELGAAVTYICCRAVGTVLTVYALLCNRHGIPIRLGRMLKLTGGGEVIRRVTHVGMPVCVSNTFVQVGYLLINSMAISLGSLASGVYQILTTVNTLISWLWTICSTVSLPLVGNLLGAKKVTEARRAGRIVWFCGIFVVLGLSVLICSQAEFMCGLFSSNPEMIAGSASILWILIIMDVPGVAINAMDPQLQAGGDTRFVMTYTLAAVWLVRLPLSWLFAYRLGWGVLGLFAANAVSLYVRAAIGFIRHCGTKWYAKRV